MKKVFDNIEKTILAVLMLVLAVLVINGLTRIMFL